MWLRSILAWATRRIFGDSILSRVISACRPCHSVQEYTEWVITRDACRRTFHEEVNTHTQLRLTATARSC